MYRRVVVLLILVPFLLFYALPAGAVEKEERKWQDETMYFLMIDRFNNGDLSNDIGVDVKNPVAYQGGDFQGVIDKLDYLKDMGFTTLSLSPIFDNVDNGYHGYWIKDFYKPDEHFGSMEKFKELVKEAHKRHIKIVLDFAANHVGPNHPWLNDPTKKNWFHEKKSNANDLPDLNTENPEVQKYLFDVAKYWIKETNIDGYRLDTVRHVPIVFLQKFSKEVKAEKPNFLLMGEVYDPNPNTIKKYKNSGIDSFLDFPFNEEARKVFAKSGESTDRLSVIWDYDQTAYKNRYLRGTFMDNLDMPRFTQDIVKNKEYPGTRWEMALTYMYTVPGIPVVYYGSEIALNGGDDPDNRKFMNFRADKDLMDYMSTIGRLRQELPSLTRGDMKVLYEKDGMVVFKRHYKEETVIVAINNSKSKMKVTLTNKEVEKNKELTGLLNGDLVRSDHGKYTIVMEREKAEIYALTDKTGLNIPFISGLIGVYIFFTVFFILVWRRGRKARRSKSE
jgi:glycosidase